MELHQLRYFTAVAREGNFTRAAEACGVAQPSLSQQIQKLEKELGTPLFDRMPRSVILTEAGKKLKEMAADILTSVDEARRRIVDDPAEVSGRLAIGVIPTIAPFVLPKVLRSYTRRFPDVAIHVEESVTETLLQEVSEGELDLAILALPIEHDRLHAESLYDEPLLLAMSADHPLAKRKRVTWEHLAQERLLVLHDMHCLGDQVMGLCRRHSLRPDYAFRGAQLATIQHMITLGMGVSLIPEMAARSDNTTSRVYRAIAGDSPYRTIAVAWHLYRYRTTAARRMLEELQRFARQYSSENGGRRR